MTKSDNFPATKPKDMEYCNLTDKELKRAVIKKFNKLQENSKVNKMMSGINRRSTLPKRLTS